MQASQSTVDPAEIAKFQAMADEWWDPNGKFKPLHMLNPCRLDYITQQIAEEFDRDLAHQAPFSGLRILDIGCGGGLISEPMTRLGADVTAIDASSRNINIAKAHAKKNNLKIAYLNTDPENLAQQKKFDIILNLEVVEHVEDLDLYLESCFKLLKPKGIMFTATLNRTLTSYVKAIVGAEYILRWLPIGTHDWNKFIKPEELEKKLTNLNFSIINLTGLSFNPFFQEWNRTKNLSVNYILVSQKD